MNHLSSNVFYDAEEGGFDILAVPGVVDRVRTV
jgi:hypothetical protein